MKVLICLSCRRMAEGPIDHAPGCNDAGMEVETFAATFPAGVIDRDGDILAEPIGMRFIGRATDYELASDGTKVVRAVELLSVSLVEKPLRPDWTIKVKEPINADSFGVSRTYHCELPCEPDCHDTGCHDLGGEG